MVADEQQQYLLVPCRIAVPSTPAQTLLCSFPINTHGYFPISQAGTHSCCVSGCSTPQSWLSKATEACWEGRFCVKLGFFVKPSIFASNQATTVVMQIVCRRAITINPLTPCKINNSICVGGIVFQLSLFTAQSHGTRSYSSPPL